ncbi:MAG: SpoIIE family protein phosphatase [Candidatus Poribacteria bacterium]|nr:SpoIIE family protein phosphatase [Candidatus Poribacteria bacterium]
MRQGLILTSYLILAAFGFVSQGAAQESNFVPVTGIRVLTLEAVHSGAVLSSAPWKYHPGDNPEWASPTFDDTAWESISTLLSGKVLSENRWEGIGWFRLHLSVPDEQLWNLPLALHVTYQAGAAEIYLDGELIYKFGTVGTRRGEEKPYWERNPQVISFSGKTDHVIAVRYSNFSSPKVIPIRGFELRLTELNPNIKRHVTIVREVTTFQMVWTAISIFMMLQHLLLFIFYPRARENFYFAISIGSIGAFVFLGFQLVFLATSVTQMLFLLQLLVCVYVLMFLAGMLFLYTLFYPKLPKLFWFFLMGWVIPICLIFLDVDTAPMFGATMGGITVSGTQIQFEVSLAGFLFLSLLTALTFLEMARVIIVAIFKKKDGAWIFGLGSLMPIILPFMFTFFVSYTRYDGNINWQFSALAITLAPLFSMSVYLARNFSRTHRKLETEALERQLLEVENTRKTEELEEARKLQMSMLPQDVPQLPNLEVAFKMQPATEVGGDYYDYNLTEDNRLTLAIGDATGHGMNAGLVVSAVKSLFKTSAPDADNLETLDRISQGIKSMNLKRLYMVMTLITFNHNKLDLAGAGMPPTLIYRANEDLVEEILLEGMPLGGFIGAEREEASFELQPGDTLLFMSDGLPEMLNPENEMLDYPKTKELFAEVASQSPQMIIDHLFNAGMSWAQGRPPEDDVTLVVMKMK